MVVVFTVRYDYIKPLLLLFSYLVRLDTQNPDVLYLRARVFYGQGDNAKAIAHCLEALRCDPDFSKARVLVKKARALDAQKDKGNAAFKSNNLQEAYDAYSSALEIDDQNDVLNAKLYSNRAAVLQKVILCALIYWHLALSSLYENLFFLFCRYGNIFLVKKIRRST